MKYILIILMLLLPACSVKPKKALLSYKHKEKILDNINNTDRKKLQKLLNNI